jgi:hypothetical protein
LVPVSVEHQNYQAIITHVLNDQNVAGEYMEIYSTETELVLFSNCMRTISKTTAFSSGVVELKGPDLQSSHITATDVTILSLFVKALLEFLVRPILKVGEGF